MNFCPFTSGNFYTYDICNNCEIWFVKYEAHTVVNAQVINLTKAIKGFPITIQFTALNFNREEKYNQYNKGISKYRQNFMMPNFSFFVFYLRSLIGIIFKWIDGQFRTRMCNKTQYFFRKYSRYFHAKNCIMLS